MQDYAGVHVSVLVSFRKVAADVQSQAFTLDATLSHM
jgi:hypothetical protein